MKEQPKVLIVILNYITYKLTIDVIKELREKLDYGNYSIMVIDNHSPNESVKLLMEKSIEMDFILYANNENSGYAAGNNIGIRYSITNNFDYTWILNNDVRLNDKSILKKMIDTIESNSEISCIGPEIIDLDGYRTAPYVEEPSLFSLSVGIPFARMKRKRYIGMSGYVYRIYGCCMLLRNGHMDFIDCMDERTFLYCEEEILAERLKKINGKMYYLSSTSIIHLESMTVNRSAISKQKIKIVMSSLDIYLKDYLQFNYPSRLLCKFTRALIMLLRG